MCMSGPGLVVSCGYESSPGLSETDNTRLNPSNWRGAEIPCDMVIEK